MKGRKGGIDCVGLVLLVAEELGIAYNDTSEMRGKDYMNYPHDGLNAFVLSECKKRLLEKPVKDIKRGDVVVMRVDGVTCHCGIITEGRGTLNLIHALNSNRRVVVEHRLDEVWMQRICGAFSYPGVID